MIGQADRTPQPMPPTATDRMANIEESVSRLEATLNVLQGKLEPMPTPDKVPPGLKAVAGPGLLERVEIVHQRLGRLVEEFSRAVDRL